MLSKDAFINFVLKGPEKGTGVSATPKQAALPDGFEGFELSEERQTSSSDAATFARRLLEASGFGYPELVGRDSVIRSSDPVAGHLPDRVSFWPKTPSREYQTLLFETPLTNKQLLAIPAFRGRKMSYLDIVEDALARLVSEALDGFHRGGELVKSDVRKGRKEETLCIVSIVDEREGEPVRLVCFGTQNNSTGGLETFQITERTRFWDAQLAREHLGLVYERQFKKLAGGDWQQAFTTTEERRQAENLLEICTRKAPREVDIQEGVLDLLDTIAKGFGLKRKPNTARRLLAFDLPADHDIGMNADERSAFGGRNPFKGVILRDERNRLLGYIIYPLKTHSDATKLRKHLEANNRFHNVLVVYPDQDQASLQLWQGQEQLIGKLRKGQGYRDAADVVNLLSKFFVVGRAKVKNPTELAQELAYRARYLHGLAVKQLEKEKEKGPLRNLYNAFKTALVHDQTEDQFADAFAQTITYGLLTARWTGNDQLLALGERYTRQSALRHLPPGSPFLNDLFKTVLSLPVDEQHGHLLWLVDDIADLLDRVDVAYVFGPGDKGTNGSTDPVIHFYEPFLAAYDPKLKNSRGVFFTPRPVVSYIVRSVHEVLQREFELKDGLAATDTWADVAKRHKGLLIPEGVSPDETFVCVLDPATGTGTFLYECIEVIEQTLKNKWCAELGATDWKADAVMRRWNSYVKTHVIPRLYGYELLMAPYAIAHLKLTLKLAETGYRLTEDDRLNIFLTDSLASPTTMADSKLADMFTRLAAEAHEVGEVKRRRRFTIVIGNPPYLREKERGPGGRPLRIGGWIRFGDATTKHALFDDFLAPLAKRNRGVHAKLAYELSVMFWRLAVWTVFEKQEGPGIVAMISPRAYISGPGHVGMREWIRNDSSHLWITDLGGDNRGARKSENIFQIETGVSIAVCFKSPNQDMQNGKVHYLDVTGTAFEKLQTLKESSVFGLSGWLDCPATSDTFLPSSSGDYPSWPKLTDLFPWQHSGSQFKRLWPIAEARDVLEERWRRLVGLPRQQRAKAFIETRDRLAAKSAPGAASKKYTGIADIEKSTPHPTIIRYCYRSLDRQWCFADERLADFLRPSLVRTLGPRQIFGATLMSKTLGSGPAVSITNCLPDMDVFCNRGAKDIIPLWRNAAGTQANVTRGVLEVIGSRLGINVRPEDLFCYCVAVLAGPAYTSTFASELATPGIRIPLTLDKTVFGQGVLLGARVVWLQTFGELWVSKSNNRWSSIVGSSKVTTPISNREDSYPSRYAYDENSQKLVVGSGVISNVSPTVYKYSVSGFKVVDSWLRYRMAQRGGRARRKNSSSELDEIRPKRWTFTDELLQLLWVLEGCVSLWPELTTFLEHAMRGEQIVGAALPHPTSDEQKEPQSDDAAQPQLL
jgi:hypothetical protein